MAAVASAPDRTDAADEAAPAETRPVLDRRSKRNIAALFVAQAILGGQLLIAMVYAPLAATVIAPNPAWVTAPITAQVVAGMLASAPLSLLMGRIGRRPGFLLSALCGGLGALAMAAAVVVGSFPMLLLGAAGLGVYQAGQNLFRFAACDTTPEPFRAQAIGWVLGGGLFAAVIGRTVGVETADWLDPAPFAGAFLGASLLALVGSVAFAFLDIPKPIRKSAAASGGRSLREIFAQPAARVALICGMVSYALMTLVMTSTSTAMVVICGYTHGEAGSVIGVHVIAMFAPSFFTGAIIRRIGHGPVIAIGLALLAACGAIASLGVSLTHFYSALALLGVGWNFGFIGATSLLASTHRPEERAKVQGLNDFCVFGLVAVASLGSGALLKLVGWQAISLAMIPFLSLAAAALVWFAIRHGDAPRAA